MAGRNLIDVIDSMLALVPKESDVYHTLNSIRTSEMYRAPENRIGWTQVSEMLNEFTFNKHTPEWQLAICSIFSTIPLEQIKEQLKDKE